MLISGKDNPKVKLYRKLYESKKARGETGLFVAEGIINCIDLAQLAEKGLFGIEVVFYTREAVEKYRGQLDTAALEDFDPLRRYEITPEVAEKMGGVEKTQGVFAIAKKLDRKLTAEEISPRGKYLVLDSVQDPGNLGTMIRTSAAVGIEGLIMTGNTVDLYNPKVVRSAMASMPRVKLYIEKDYAKAVELLNTAGIKTCAAVVHGGESAREFDFSGGCAVVIGNEARGLSQEDAALCTRAVTIPMNGDMDSLNAAIAGTILLWEMSCHE